MQAAKGFGPGKEMDQFRNVTTLKMAGWLKDTVGCRGRHGVHILKDPAQIVRRVTVKLALHAVGYAGGNIMDDGFHLGFVEAEPEGGTGAAEVLCGKIGGGFFSARAPDVADGTGEITKHRRPVNLVFHFFFAGGQVHRFRRKTGFRLTFREVTSHGFFGESQGFQQLRQFFHRGIWHDSLHNN